MAQHIVMDHVTGDTRHNFDLADAVGLAEAEKRFQELTGVGFAAAERLPDGATALMRKFDPTVETTVFFPQLQGG